MKPIKILLLFTFSAGFLSCKKYLDKKPSAALVIPSSAKDAQSILDNALLFNASWPFNLELASDDLYISSAEWESRPAAERNTYIWAENVFNENPINAWSTSYNIIYTANIVLDETKKGLAGSLQDINNVEGQALFFRAFAFYHLVQLFAPPYNNSDAATKWGIPLRLDADFNKPTTRASLAQSYAQITEDLKRAVNFLPSQQAVKTRPSKQAALTLLARVALIMGKNNEAALFAEQALAISNRLLNYNTLNELLARPIALFNDEVHFHSTLISATSLVIQAKVDSVLYNSYETNDRRRLVNFRRNADGSYTFKAGHEGSGRIFNGFTNGELYLIKAEALARLNNTTDAMNTLNSLLVTRWRTGTFIPLTASDQIDALNQILKERRKELLFRGIRWTDLRRLNQDPATAKIIQRKINNTAIPLEPNSKRYTFKIPLNVIQFTGIQQNE
jgi:starch-binding outer membrane protein, SusD/RagB family